MKNCFTYMWRPKRPCALRKLFFIKNVFHELCPNLREQIALMSNMHSLSSKNFRKTACFFLFFSSKNLTVLYKNSVLFLFLSSKNVKVLHKKVFCFYFNPLKVLQFFRKIVRCFYFCVTLILILDFRDMHRQFYWPIFIPILYISEPILDNCRVQKGVFCEK